MVSWDTSMEFLRNVTYSICHWIFEWRTLAGALLALIAAWLTIRVMRRQMQAEADRHEGAARRKGLAARAQMPDALSEIGSYVRGCAENLTGRNGSLPSEPIPAVTTLKQVIEFIDDGAAARTFELVSWYQVLHSRLSHDIPHRSRPEFADRMYDLALMQAYIDSLYAYARNEETEVDAPKPSREEMHAACKSAFGLMHIVQQENLYANVGALIERRHKPRHPH